MRKIHKKKEYRRKDNGKTVIIKNPNCRWLGRYYVEFETGARMCEVKNFWKKYEEINQTN